jgi:hypothetical protein
VKDSDTDHEESPIVSKLVIHNGDSSPGVKEDEGYGSMPDIFTVPKNTRLEFLDDNGDMLPFDVRSLQSCGDVVALYSAVPKEYREYDGEGSRWLLVACVLGVNKLVLIPRGSGESFECVMSMVKKQVQKSGAQQVVVRVRKAYLQS